MIEAIAVKIFVKALWSIVTAKVSPKHVCKLADKTHHLRRKPGPRVKGYPTVAEELRDAKEILPDKPTGHADGFSPDKLSKPSDPLEGSEVPDGDQ